MELYDFITAVGKARESGVKEEVYWDSNTIIYIEVKKRSSTWETVTVWLGDMLLDSRNIHADRKLIGLGFLYLSVLDKIRWEKCNHDISNYIYGE